MTGKLNMTPELIQMIGEENKTSTVAITDHMYKVQFLW